MAIFTDTGTTSYYDDANTTNIYISRPIQIETNTPSGTEIKLTGKKENGIYHPRLYFKYVKSKLTDIQKKKLDKRLSKLKKLIVQSYELEQDTLYEELTKMLAIVVRESEAYACGITKWIDREHIDKFMDKVQEKSIKFKPLDEFTRVIPTKVAKIIKEIKKRELFDEYWVLYYNSLQEKDDEIKSNKQKIEEKDPILFGCYKYQPNRFYYITDWIDEYCNLTLDKFVQIVKEDDPYYSVTDIPDLNEKSINDILKQVMRRTERFINTNSRTWRQDIKEDKKDKINLIKSKKIFRKIMDSFKHLIINK